MIDTKSAESATYKLEITLPKMVLISFLVTTQKLVDIFRSKTNQVSWS